MRLALVCLLVLRCMQLLERHSQRQQLGPMPAVEGGAQLQRGGRKQREPTDAATLSCILRVNTAAEGACFKTPPGVLAHLLWPHMRIRSTAAGHAPTSGRCAPAARVPGRAPTHHIHKL